MPDNVRPPQVMFVLMSSDDGTQHIQVTDNTVSLLNLPPGKILSKPEIEDVQIEHFIKRAEIVRPDLAVQSKVRGKDPPDFLVSRQGQLFGLDVAALAFDKYRKAIAQFEELKDRLRRAYTDEGRLRQCQGVCIDVGFGEPDPNGRPSGKPPRELSESLMAEIIEAFERFILDPEVWNRDWTWEVTHSRWAKWAAPRMTRSVGT